MPTVLEGTPELPEVLKSADLVLIGQVADVVDEESDMVDEENERSITTVQFAVEEMLSGRADFDSVEVRLVPELAERVGGKAKRFLLALSSDSSSQREERGRFVPQFSYVLPLDGDTIADPQQRDAKSSEFPHTVSEIREAIESIREEQERDVRLASESGENEFDDQEDDRNDVGERPDDLTRDLSVGEVRDLSRSEMTGLIAAAPLRDSAEEAGD